MNNMESNPIDTTEDEAKNIPVIEDSDPAIEWIMSRSSGPGGQNVNKTETKATLRFHLDACDQLNEEQRKLLRAEIPSSHLADEGAFIVVSSQKNRTQRGNKVDALQKLNTFLCRALEPRKSRKTECQNPQKESAKRRHAKKTSAPKNYAALPGANTARTI